MHILVTNDDGPPSNQSSPYVHSLIKTLQSQGHKVSVVLPHTQRSWIGKAHFVGQVAKPTYFRPGTLHKDDGTVHSEPLQSEEQGEEWVLIDGTPATCAQLGLYHFFQERGPVDLVVSGPNYGRNSTALFSLSSGTIGGAMEAAVCGKRAIALSYAFYSRDNDPEVVAEASRISTKVIEHLSQNWGDDVDLYSINVPLKKGVESNKVMITNCLPNTWKSGSSFKEAENENLDPEKREEEIREGKNSTEQSQGEHPRHRHRAFKWAPVFTDVYQSVENSAPGNDGWTINQGMTSVTPLKAKFAEAQAHPLGELKLSSNSQKPRFSAYVAYEDPYVQPLITSGLSIFNTGSFELLSTPSSSPDKKCLYILPYESLDHEKLLADPKYYGNAYTIRKALIRKHYLSNTVASWIPKHPDSILKTHVPVTIDFELDYAEFLDDALLEAYELHEAWARNASKALKDREWWILKPGMSDRGQGIRLFSTEEELTGIFEEWEAENPDSEDEQEDGIAGSHQGSDHADSDEEGSTKGLITSQLRHFVAQPYIAPLLLPAIQSRKFHIRSYVLCVGALRVYVYRYMLALFSAESYIPPGHPIPTPTTNDSSPDSTTASELDLRRHLTNTCLQNGDREGSVSLLSQLPLAKDQYYSVVEQIQTATGELFRAAAANPTTFQPLPKAFEVFGVDWLVDELGKPWLLEVNAFPDFRQTGEELSGVVGGFWEGVLGVVGKELFEVEGAVSTGMDLVLDLDMGRR